MLGFFKKKQDPLAARTRALNAQIAELEAQIKELQSGKETPVKAPEKASPKPPPREPVFETLAVPPSNPPTRVRDEDKAHFNDLGARKYDLLAALRKLKSYFSGPDTSNPKLVSYLAAGSIKGLRPLRYEKRVARNRFIALSIFFVLLLWGLLAVIFKQH